MCDLTQEVWWSLDFLWPLKTFILKILQHVCLSELFPPFSNFFKLSTQKPALQSASYHYLCFCVWLLWLSSSRVPPRVGCELQPGTDALARGRSSRGGRIWLLSDPGGNISEIFQISEVQKSKVAQCKLRNSWKSKCTSFPLLWHVNDRGSQGLVNLSEEIQCRQEWDERSQRTYSATIYSFIVFQVPVIAIAGSGGGFRAMVGFAGVMKALFESGVLDCATYVAGLSGSTWSVLLLPHHPLLWLCVSLLPCFWCPCLLWQTFLPALLVWARTSWFSTVSYLWWTLLDLTSLQALTLKDFPFQNWTFINIVQKKFTQAHKFTKIALHLTDPCVYSPFTCRYMSTLYSHPDFPDRGPKDINKELMNRVSSNPLRLLMPQHITNYIQALWTKKATGQPVTFTDIFGMLIGETLVPAVRAVWFISVFEYSYLFFFSRF